MNARQLYLIRQEVARLQGQLGDSYPGCKVRAITSVTRNLLLEGSYFWRGRLLDPKVKSLGAGVYEIWVEEANAKTK